MKQQNLQSLVTWVCGLAAAGALTAMCWMTLDPTIEISSPVLMTMLLLTYSLLYGADKSGELLDRFNVGPFNGTGGGGGQARGQGNDDRE